MLSPGSKLLLVLDVYFISLSWKSMTSTQELFLNCIKLWVIFFLIHISSVSDNGSYKANGINLKEQCKLESIYFLPPLLNQPPSSFSPSLQQQCPKHALLFQLSFPKSVLSLEASWLENVS